MAEKVNLTDRKLKSLKPAKPGERYEVADTDVSGLRVRVTDKGKKTFSLLARYPGSKNPTRRALGEYPTDSLADARKKARQWRQWIRKGQDPALEQDAQRRAEQRKQADTFDAVLDTYITSVLSRQRRGDVVERDLRREVGSRWKGRPITSIERRDVLAVVNEITARSARYQARNVFAYLRAMFNWAIEAGDYGLEISPCDRIRPKYVIGELPPRDRVLTDAEIRALWNSCDFVGYPFGPLVQLLLLTGVRRTEASGARWHEFDLDREDMWTLTQQPVWTIPSERFKAKFDHLVPLPPQTVALLKGILRFAEGDYVFSTTGAKPVTGFSKAKKRIDLLMQEELGDAFAPWRLHDLRRTVRTRLASLRVADEVAEMVIGHGKQGLRRVYDQHSYLPEMREALERWSNQLHSIVEPPPDNIVKLRADQA